MAMLVVAYESALNSYSFLCKATFQVFSHFCNSWETIGFLPPGKLLHN